MGISLSSNRYRRRSNNNVYANANGYYHTPYHPPPPNSYSHFTSTSYPLYNSDAYPPPNPPYPYHHAHFSYSSGFNYADNFVGYDPSYYSYQHNGFCPPTPLVAPSPGIESQQAKKIRNDVNVHRHTLKLEVDQWNPDRLLLSFVFDALLDGRVTIFYFAKEVPGCVFVPVLPEIYKPVHVSFVKGLRQTFRQPSGTGSDLGFVALDDLLKSFSGDVFPLVISAETCPPPLLTGECHIYPPLNTSSVRQITLAVLEKDHVDHYKVRVVKQILWIDGVRYELREIYGIENAPGSVTNDSGKDCVICMTEPMDTAVLPCRHMCMCSECAKALRLQSNKCPVCRQAIEELIEIETNNDINDWGASLSN